MCRMQTNTPELSETSYVGSRRKRSGLAQEFSNRSCTGEVDVMLLLPLIQFSGIHGEL
jgi:hypothetical protein